MRASLLAQAQARPRLAAILADVGRCRRLKVPVRGYLGAILLKLANAPIRRTADLAFAAWVPRRTTENLKVHKPRIVNRELAARDRPTAAVTHQSMSPTNA